MDMMLIVTTVRTLLGLGLDDRTIATAVGKLATAGADADQPRNGATAGNRKNAKSAPAVIVPKDGAVTYRAAVNIDRLNRMGKLTPQQRRVAEYVIKNPGQTSAQIAAATDIGTKAVQSPIYQLRVTRPAVLKSSRD